MSEGSELTGGCLCGKVRYSINAPPLAVVACHCTRCRRQSGAAYSVNLVVRAASMTFEGDPTGWEEHETESGQPLSREHCDTCGAPIRSVMPAVPQIVVVKAGSLDDPAPFAPAMHIWTQSKLPWVELPAGVPSFPQSAPR